MAIRSLMTATPRPPTVTKNPIRAPRNAQPRATPILSQARQSVAGPSRAQRSRIPRLMLGAALLFGLGISSTAFANQFDEMLKQADAVRSRDPAAFDAAISRIDRSEKELAPRQRQFLRLLKAYRMAFRGQYDNAIKDASALYEESQDP